MQGKFSKEIQILKAIDSLVFCVYHDEDWSYFVYMAKI
jgi:hypothetical protein